MQVDEEELDKILEEAIKDEEEDLGSTCSVFSSEEDFTQEKELTFTQEKELTFTQEKDLTFTQEKDFLDNPIQKKHEKIIHLLYVFLAISCMIFGSYVFYIFLDIKFDKLSIFKNKCCINFYNETRCLLDYYCKELLKFKMDKNYLVECCYWLSPYCKNSTNLYCNPDCLG